MSKGSSYISAVAGFKDTHYGLGGEYVSGTLIEGFGKQARLQKQLLKSTKTEEERFDLLLYTTAVKYDLTEYKGYIDGIKNRMKNLRYKNPLALLYAAKVINPSDHKINEVKFNELFGEEKVSLSSKSSLSSSSSSSSGDRGKPKSISRIKNGVRDIDVIRYAFYIRKI